MLEELHNRILQDIESKQSKPIQINSKNKYTENNKIDITIRNEHEFSNDTIYYYKFKLKTNISSIEYILSCNRWEKFIQDEEISKYYDYNDKIQNIKKYHDRNIINIASKALNDYIERNNFKGKIIQQSDIIYKYCRIVNETLIVYIIDDIMIAHIAYMLLQSKVNNVVILKMNDLLSYSIESYEIDSEYIEAIELYYNDIKTYYNETEVSEFINDEKCNDCGFLQYCKNNPNSIVFEKDKEIPTSIQGVIFN